MSTEPAAAPTDLNDLVIEPSGENPNPAPEPAPEPAPTTREIEIGGQKYTVSPEMADALLAQEAQRKREHEELLARINQTRQPEPAPAEPAVTTENIEDLIFTDPQKVIDNLKAELRDEYQKDKLEQEKIAQQKTQLDQFYDDFYKTNPELASNKKLVETVLKMNYNDWQHLSVEQVAEKLANEARDTIMPHMERNPTPDSGIVLESGGQNPVPAAEPVSQPDDNDVKSLSDVIKRRAKARREKTGLQTPRT